MPTLVPIGGVDTPGPCEMISPTPSCPPIWPVGVQVSKCLPNFVRGKWIPSGIGNHALMQVPQSVWQTPEYFLQAMHQLSNLRSISIEESKIVAVRKVFPLQTYSLTSTSPGPGISIGNSAMCVFVVPGSEYITALLTSLAIESILIQFQGVSIKPQFSKLAPSAQGGPFGSYRSTPQVLSSDLSCPSFHVLAGTPRRLRWNAGLLNEDSNTNQLLKEQMQYFWDFQVQFFHP